MTLPLTREMLAASYDFLRTTPPFNRWKMPPSSVVKFVLTRDPITRGYYEPVGTSGHIIGVSSRNIVRTQALVELMAHEMIHLYQREAKTESPGVEHNKAFWKLANRVCKYHGFDPGLF